MPERLKTRYLRRYQTSELVKEATYPLVCRLTRHPTYEIVKEVTSRLVYEGSAEGMVQHVQSEDFLTSRRSHRPLGLPFFLGGRTDMVSCSPVPLNVFSGLRALGALFGGGFGLGRPVVSYEPLSPSLYFSADSYSL